MLLPPEKVVKFKDFEGKDLALKNSADYKIKDFKIEGVIEQEKREGYNLLNIDIDFPITKNGITLTRNNDGTIIANGTATAFTVFDLTPDILQYPSGTYRLSTFYVENNISSIYGVIKSDDDMINISNTNDDYIFSATQNWQLYVDIQIQNGAVCNNLILPLMLVLGSEEKPYEPYGISPSLANPSEIYGLGDSPNLYSFGNFEHTSNGVNVVQKQNILSLNGTTIESNYVIGGRTQIYVLHPGTYYFSSKLIKGNISSSQGDWNFKLKKSSLTSYILNDLVSFTKNTGFNYDASFTLTETSIIYAHLYINVPNMIFNDVLVEFQLTKDRAYSSTFPYGSIIKVNNSDNTKNQEYLLNTRSVNLFDRDTMIEFDGQYRQYASGNIGKNSQYYGLKIPIEPNAQFTFSNTPEDKSNLCFFDNNFKYISGVGGGAATSKNSWTFTTPVNCYYVTLAIHKGNNLNDFKLVKGDTYNPDYIFYEGEIPYIEDGKVYYDKKWNNLIITGNEFTTSNAQIEILNNTVEVNFVNILSNGLAVNENKIVTNLFVSKYGDNSDTEHIRNGNSQYLNNLVLYIDKSNLSSYDLEGIKALFNAKNLQVVYKITPIKTEITGELAEQIKNLYNNIHTYKGETHLSIEEYGKISGQCLLNNLILEEVFKKLQ